MTERGKARYTLLAAGSNSTIKNASGTLYGVVSNNPSGSTIRLDDSLNLGAAPDFNTTGASTITNAGGAYLDFTPGAGFNTGLTVAATSNARVTVIWE